MKRHQGCASRDLRSRIGLVIASRRGAITLAPATVAVASGRFFLRPALAGLISFWDMRSCGLG